MCELLYITFHPCFRQLAAVLAFLLCLPWGSPGGGALPRRASCVLGGPSLRGKELFPWLASGSSAAAVAVSRLRVPLQPTLAALSAQQAFSVSVCWSRKRATRSVCGIPRGFNEPNSGLGCFHPKKQPAETLALWHAWADGNRPWKDFLCTPEGAAAEKMQHSCVFPV